MELKGKVLSAWELPLQIPILALGFPFFWRAKPRAAHRWFSRNRYVHHCRRAGRLAGRPC